jgi:cysteine-rich repeat protein
MKTYCCLLLATLGLAFTKAAPAPDGVAGDACQRNWNGNAGKYLDNIQGSKCGNDLVCLVEEGDTGGQSGVVDGTCVAETCGGQKDTTGNGPATAETIRVTICHRTCSETNPWVRITIDDDAWNGTSASGCGHEQQHDIWDECKNKAPWKAWGSHHKDYLIKWHGTKNQVGASLSKSEEKAYWKYWEPACPFVRGEGCCDWATGSCCGDDPNVKRCGDNTMDDNLGETCDDGNIIDGDGCSSTCQIEPPTVCTENGRPIVELMYSSPGAAAPPDNLLEIETEYTSDGAQMAKFRIRNTFDETMDRFYIEYHEQVEGSGYNTKCYLDSNLEGDAYMVDGEYYEAVCSQSTDAARINVYVMGSGVGEATVKIPNCCHYTPQESGDEVEGDTPSPSQSPTTLKVAVVYTYHVMCKCPTEDRSGESNLRSLLRGTTN